MNKRLGKFGEFVKQYEKARRPYPPEVFAFMKSLIKVKKVLILDLGCGTGISTRQLVRLGTVTGADSDLAMLRAARKHKTPKVSYILASADKLPFEDGAFDVITAFSAFHWFTDKISVREIRRVLKPNGVFFVGSKIGIIDWGREYRDTIIKAIGREIAEFKSKSYNPRKILQENKFKNIKYRQWWKSEFFSLPRVMRYVQSVSIWNSVPKSLRPKALAAVEQYYRDILKKRGNIKRRLKVSMLAAMK